MKNPKRFLNNSSCRVMRHPYTAREDYEYFQLFDPDDSDLDSESDPDVHTLFTSYLADAEAKKPPDNLQTCFIYLCNRMTKCQLATLCGGLVLILATVVTGLALGLESTPQLSLSLPGEDGEMATTAKKVLTTASPEGGVDDPLVKPAASPSELGNFSMAAVSIDGAPCAEIGLSVLRRNGTAVDAAVAALFCNGLINPQSMGIGGGFLMTIYLRQQQEAITLNARETAPGAATADMYHGDHVASSVGPKSVAIPGEIRGYWAAKQRYGNPNITWASLVQPSVEMCLEGIPLTASASKALENKKDVLFKDPGMRAIFFNPATNDTWKEGETYTRKNLANTLARIALYGDEEFYKGTTAEHLVNDLQAAGGIITKEDLRDYNVTWASAVSVRLDGSHFVHSVPPPGSGSILAYILNILQHYKISPGDDRYPVLYHRIIEAFKWAYAVRTKLGDPADEEITDMVNELVANMTSVEWGLETFSNINDSFTVNDPSYYGADIYLPVEDHGTAHASILAPNGDAVSVTSTVNLHFGSSFMSQSTGIILNDEMDDFSFPYIVNEFGVPPSPNNFVKPGKRPLSSMSPAIFTDALTGDVRLVVGAAGGTKITTATALTAIKNIWLEENLKRAIDDRRVHHQLIPMRVDYEEGLTQDVTTFLKSRGHKLNKQDVGESIVCGVSKEPKDNRVYANADFRKSGGVAGI